MLVPVEAVHKAAAALTTQGDIHQTEFEDHYHCKIGLSPDLVNYYYLHFNTEKDASIFLLRWA